MMRSMAMIGALLLTAAATGAAVLIVLTGGHRQLAWAGIRCSPRFSIGSIG